MDWTPVEQALAALKAALDAGEPVGAFLTCGDLLAALLSACYRADGLTEPGREALFSRLPETRLGREFLPNLEAYARVCRRLDGIVPGRDAESYPQYSDARRLLDRMSQF